VFQRVGVVLVSLATASTPQKANRMRLPQKCQKCPMGPGKSKTCVTMLCAGSEPVAGSWHCRACEHFRAKALATNRLLSELRPPPPGAGATLPGIAGPVSMAGSPGVREHLGCVWPHGYSTAVSAKPNSKASRLGRVCLHTASRAFSLFGQV